MRVLVTGAAGFVGNHVTRQLANAGDEVIVVERPDADLKRLSDVKKKVSIQKCNLKNSTRLAKIVTDIRPQACINLAWYTVHGKYWTAGENLECVANSLNLARILAANGCSRLVSIGTCAEYDWSYEHLKEFSTPCKPRTLYGAAKYALFLMLEEFCKLCSVQFAWPRYNFIYGPGEHPARLVPSVIAKFLRGEDAPCTHGKQIRDFMYVEDVAAATVATMRSKVTGPVNIGSGKPVAVREVVETLSSIIGGKGKPLFGAIPAPSEEPGVLIPDVGRLHKEVRWQPEYSLAEGLKHTVEALREPEQR